ncbi:MAG: hypothetical protein OXH13_01620 [Chloroflexi bacterium]|nr:hypothetical protein [Chloroflexota bacterium]MCY3697332.1 hypothetical protein [Chloroflexota bacterium]MYB22351.1 hypothetical protein [Chloroflexota bacterium]MYF81884.1 hypothetical protein [Chloroflexota bacterium]MYI04076.1 hypothetical protein [Chloroflexota bacterium]
MAIINIQRFRDTLVRVGVAEEAPALEVSVALDSELEQATEDFITGSELDTVNSHVDVRASELRQQIAEMEARFQQALNRQALLIAAYVTLVAAVAGILVAVLG